jgi:hypothetical protein
VWFDDHAIAAWRNAEPAAGPGAPRTYSDLAIECALVFKAVYHLSLRAAQGFLSSVVELMKLPLPIPDYSTVSRRHGALHIHLSPTLSHSPRHVVIDATGLRVYGAGEGHAKKHWLSDRRTWRKLHLGVDERTRETVAMELTGSRRHDSQPLPALLEQVADPLVQVSGGGAYDTRACYVGIVQSLLASCRLQGVDPYVYLVDVLQRIDTHPAFDVHLLTPRLWKQHFAANPLRSDLDRLCQ